jgi:hypothetical protein
MYRNDMGRPRKYKVLKLKSDFDQMDAYIQENTTELMEHVLFSIEHALKSELSVIEVFQFTRSPFSITLSDDIFQETVSNIYNRYIETEQYELCARVVKLQQKLVNPNYDEEKGSSKKGRRENQSVTGSEVKG